MIEGVLWIYTVATCLSSQSTIGEAILPAVIRAKSAEDAGLN